MTKQENLTKLGVSACLCGQNVRYDAGSCRSTQLPSHADWVAICPEVMGGLSIPREPAEIVGGDGHDVWQGKAKVLTQSGQDVTAAFKHGAQLALQRLQDACVDEVYLKSKSPSCGRQQIYDGSFTGCLTAGDGVTTALFKQHGITVHSL